MIKNKIWKHHRKLEGSMGSINSCKDCSGLICCGIVREGGIIEPPYLTRHDIRQIEYFTGFKKEQFAVKKNNPLTGNTIFVMQTLEKEGCIFFNKFTGKCQIFSFRPIDCRLFPLDFTVVIERGKTNYYCALYKYKECKLFKDDLSVLLKYKNEAIQIMAGELHEYATYPVPEMERIGYMILQKIKYS